MSARTRSVSARGAALPAGGGREGLGALPAAVSVRKSRGLVTAVTERRPHVTLKAAMTLDGKIADAAGASRWITGEPARAHAHRLRSESDAIVVGVTTVLRDDPELTVRLDRPWPREPYPVVLDTGRAA